jgi:nucleotide-binding universal stress UspA family protein
LRAARTGGGVSLLYIIEPADRQAWGSIEHLMRAEAQGEALRILTELSKQMRHDHAVAVEMIVREGKKSEALMKLLAEDPTIRVLVLGAASGKEGPGPLVSFLAGQVAGSLRVALTLIPGGLSRAQVESLA